MVVAQTFKLTENVSLKLQLLQTLPEGLLLLHELKEKVLRFEL